MRVPRPFRGVVGSPLAAGVLVGVLVGLSVIGVRRAGYLEALELGAYDMSLRLLSGTDVEDPRIVLLTISEDDIQRLGRWPLTDGTLAEVLDVIAGFRPRAIGLDIFRDVPVPPGSEKLDQALARHPHVVATLKFPGAGTEGVRPPRALSNSDRIGFNDILVDADGIVRRGLLFLDDGGTTVYSLAFRLALLWLQPEGIGPVPDEGDPALLRLGRTTIRPFEPNDGGYVGADARGYQFLLDFRGGRPLFPSVSLTDLLAGRIPPAALRDKVVLIGITAESVKDFFYTPFSRGLHADHRTSGIEVHGYIVHQLLRSGLEHVSPIASPTDWQEELWILLWSAAGGMIGLAVRSPWVFALQAGGGLLGLTLVDIAALRGGWWLPLVPVGIAWLTSGAVVTAYVSYRERVQRAILMQLFSRHVDERVAEDIWRRRDQFMDGRRPRSQRVIATLLFTDLTGFTSVSEKSTPEQLLDWLNEYMDAMSQDISRHGGVIKQYAGDSIVVIFGAPAARTTEAEIDQDAIDAVGCALAMEQTLHELNRRWRAAQRPTTGMRVGIFTGPVVAGTLGSGRRSEYVVVGDTVNTASRLESYDKEFHPPDVFDHPCRILIGESTARRLGPHFETEWVGEVSVKGKAQALSVFRVLGRVESASSVPRQEGAG